jgi:bifunctional UDP-N-acetylglucosamine pyrophosphorylase/glucosamine-1-phosphate N-acetyltransferase
LILSGDVPLIQENTLRDMVECHRTQKASATLLTAALDRPTGYGRVMRDATGNITGTVEEKDASDAQKQVCEVNAGIYVASSSFLFDALSKLTNHNQQSEYYLPDIVAIGLSQGQKIVTVHVADAREMMGVNTREELAYMEKNLRESINRKWMLAGVTLKDPDTTYIDESVTIGKDTVIGPNTQLRGKTIIGERCRIDGTAFITDVEIDDDVEVKFPSCLLAAVSAQAQSLVRSPSYVPEPNWAVTFISATSSKPRQRILAMGQRQTT